MPRLHNESAAHYVARAIVSCKGNVPKARDLIMRSDLSRGFYDECISILVDYYGKARDEEL